MIADRSASTPFAPVLGVAVTASLAVMCWIALIRLVQFVVG